MAKTPRPDDDFDADALPALTSIEGPTRSRLLSELEREGLIKRKPLPADSRVNSIALTRAGKDLYDRLMPYHDAVQQMSVDGLSANEVATLRRALKRVFFNTIAAAELDTGDAETG